MAEIGIKIKAEGAAAAKAGIDDVAQAVEALGPKQAAVGRAAESSAAQQTAAWHRVHEGAQSIGSQLADLRNQILAVFGVDVGLSLLRNVAATADAFNGLAARIKLVTGEGAAFEDALAGVQRVAVDTRSDLEATATLFTRIAEAGKAMGLSQQQALALTQTINQAIQVSGGSAQSAQAAITQLVQGLQSGVLRGEEFNSMMEQAPRLAQALANGLGVTTGELRRLAEAGRLSSETVIEALRGQSDVVASEFAKLPPTVGGAIQNLSSAWTVYVGHVDQASGASRAAAEAIDLLAQNLHSIGGVLMAAGKGAAALVALNLARQFADWALGAKAAAAGAATAAGATAGHTATVQANTAALQANTAAKAQNNAAVAGLAPAAGAAGAAAASAALQTGLLAQSMGLLGQAARGAVGLVGGLPGVLALTAVYAKDVGTWLGQSAGRLALWAKGQTSLEESTRKLAAAEREASAAAQERQAHLERQRLAAEQASAAQFNLGRSSLELVRSLEQLKAQGELTNQVIANIGKDFDLSTAAGIQNAGSVLDALRQKGVLSAEQFRAAWAQALDGQDLTTFAFLAQEAFGTAGRGVEQLAQALEARLAAAVQRTGVELALFSGGMSQASVHAIGDIDAVIAGMERLRTQGLDVAAVLSASIGKGIDTATTQQAIDEVRVRIEDVRAALGATVTDGLLERATHRAEQLRSALEGTKPGINSVAEAMRALGVTTQAELDGAARAARQAFLVVRNSGQATAREMQQAFAAYAKAAVAANDGVVSATLEANAAMLGLQVQADSSGRVIVASMSEAARAVDAVGDSARAAQAQLERVSAASSPSAAHSAAAAPTPTRPEPSTGSATVVPRSARQQVMLKERAGTLGQDDIELVERAVEEQQFTADTATAMRFRNAQDAVVALEDMQRILARLQGRAGASVSAPTPVNIHLNGSATRIHVASAQDAAALQGMLQQLASQATRTY